MTDAWTRNGNASVPEGTARCLLPALERGIAIIAGGLVLLIGAPGVRAGVTARYVRVENPTGCVMEWQEIEVVSGGKNVALKHPEMFSGTVVAGHDVKSREGAAMTDGVKDTTRRGPGFSVPNDEIDPWFEIDFGKPIEIEKIVLYGSRYGERFYLDKGHRVVSALDAGGKIRGLRITYQPPPSGGGAVVRPPAGAGGLSPTTGITCLPCPAGRLAPDGGVQAVRLGGRVVTGGRA